MRLSLELLEHRSEVNVVAPLFKTAAPPDRQKNRVIGHFRIFYDTTGASVPAMLTAGQLPIPNSFEEYVDSAGRLFNNAWSVEIDNLGYLPPALETDGTYWVDIHDLGFGLYGRTVPAGAPIGCVSTDGGQGTVCRYGSYVEVDNDFRGYYSSGMAGLKVTAAHEFHHALQLGGYGITGTGDYYFLEITSTWMEDVVHDDINDYYQYLSNVQQLPENSQFAYPDVRFTLGNGSIEYSRAVWGKYVGQRFGLEAMRRTWEYMRTDYALPSIDKALSEYGSSFRQAFLEWSLWNGNTGPSADTVRYYREGRHYPTIVQRAAVTYASPSRVVTGDLETSSSLYQPVLVGSGRMSVIISNVDMRTTTLRHAFRYLMQDAPQEGFRQLSNGLNVRLDVADPANWQTQESVPWVVSDVVIYPQPYRSSGKNVLVFKLPPLSGSTALLAITSSGMDRVFQQSLPVIGGPEPAVEWNGRDDDGAMTSSGVYFYILEVDGRQYSGKFVLLRE